MIPLAWIDLETTGLDPEKHELLEVACVVTDEHLQEVARFHRLIRPADGAWDRAPLVVQRMHAETGLWREAYEEGGLLERVMDDLAAFLGAHLQGERYLTLAGSYPAFEQRWLRAKAPHLDEVLSRRTFDVNALGILLGEHRGRARPHRAMPDLERDLALARRAYRLVEAGSVPSAPDPAPSPF